MEDNVKWHSGKIDFEKRCSILGQRGVVLWFTGLSGSGKSTLAAELEKEYLENGQIACRLDGDNIRHGLNSDLGFSTEDRNENIRRISEVARLFKDAGLITLVSFISPAISMRQMARDIIGDGFFEIFVQASLECCIKRDPKGLYAKALAGEIPEFTGISAPYEEPLTPDLTVDTEGCGIAESVERVIQHFNDRIRI